MSAQQSGSEITTTYFIDTRTGKALYPPLPNTFGFQWTKDQQHAYITIRSEEDVKLQRPLKTWLWKAGDPVENMKFLGTTPLPMQRIHFLFMTTVTATSLFSGQAIFIRIHCG